MIPGEIFLAAGDIEINAGRPTVTLTSPIPATGRSRSARIIISSKPTPRCVFDREQARGFRLDIPAGTATRFEPGQSREVRLVAYAGARRVVGFNGQDQRRAGLARWRRRSRARAYAGDVRPDHRRPGAPCRHRARHRDRKRSHDLWRGGQVRRRQGDPRRHGPEPGEPRRGRGRHRHHQRGDPRPLGHRQSRYRHKDGRIAGIGKAGNPDVQPGVDIIIGPGTEAIAGEGKIITAGGIDAHIHLICPQQVEEALYSGVTTMIGGGTGPAAGTAATTCTPGPWHLARIIAGGRGVPDQSRLFRQGQRVGPAGADREGRSRRLRPQTARGLGHDAGRDR